MRASEAGRKGSPRKEGSAWGPGSLGAILLEEMGDAVFLLDPEGCIQFANPAAETLTGFARGELAERPFHTLVEEELERLESLLTQAPSRQEAVGGFRILTRGGGSVPVTVHLRAPGEPGAGEGAGLIAVVRRIVGPGSLEAREREGRMAAALLDTARAAAQAETPEELCQLAANAFFTFYPAPIVAIHLLDPETQVLRLVAAQGTARAWVSRGWTLHLDPASPSLLVRAVLQDRTLVEERTALVRRFPDLRPEPDSPVTPAEVAEAFHALRVRTLADTPIRAQGEVLGVIGMASRAARVDEGAVRLLELLAHEIGSGLHRIRLESGRQRLLDDTRQAYEELATFTYALSHDLSEQLRRIATLSDLLRREYGAGLPQDANELLERIDALTLEVQGMVRGSLELSQLFRQGPLELEPVDLGDLLRATVARLDSEVARTGALVTLPTRAPEIKGDRHALDLVFEHLLANALQFNASPEPRVVVGVTERDGTVEVVVEDNGPGIPEAYREQVFVPFRKSPLEGAARAGSGFGLALVKKSVQRHGGSVWVGESGLGGAAFHVLLPRAGPPESEG